MAQLFPDASKVTIAFLSSAEERLYSLARDLPAGWRVYYSVTLALKESEGSIRENEIDFIFYHPSYGLIAVEVKGGRISLDGSTGQFYSQNRHGKEFAIKNPFQQAITFRNRLVRFLRSQDIHVPVSHGVCFPQVDEQEFPVHVNIEPETLLGRTRLMNLESSLIEIAKSFHKDHFLQFRDDASALDAVFVGATFKSRPLLREYIDMEESRVEEADQLHHHLVSPLIGMKRLGVEGEAGTGKSLLALNLANHFSSEKKQALILVSSPLLADHLRKSLFEVPVMTFQELASRFSVNLLVAPSQSPAMPSAGDAPTEDKRSENWIQYDAPELLRQKILASDFRFDALIVDEAQDAQPFWWVALEALLRDKDESSLYVFFDRNQGLFGGGEGAEAFLPETVLPVPAPYMRLGKNYRNTSEISQFASHFRQHQAAHADSDRLGFQPSILEYQDTKEAVLQLDNLLHRLLDEQGIEPHEIVLLSARAPESRDSILHGVKELGGLPLRRLGASLRQDVVADKGPAIDVATIAAFKGLEAKIVIVINLCEHKMALSNPIMASMMYVGLTRAKHMLYVLGRTDDPKTSALYKARSAIRSSGSLVISQDERPGEYLGTISHFVPGRMGVIELSAGDESLRNVIVLPQDIESSSLPRMEKNQIVKFRIKSEGGVPTAVSVIAVDDVS